MRPTNRFGRVRRPALPLDKPLKRLGLAALLGVALLGTACENFLDVNDNPNAPEVVSPNLYLPPMLHWFFMSPK